MVPSERTSFCFGQVVHHRLFGYRGVIVGVDSCFQGTDAWFACLEGSEPCRNRPWYNILVDGAEHETYVAELNLELDKAPVPVTHPLLSFIFDEFRNGLYISRRHVH